MPLTQTADSAKTKDQLATSFGSLTSVTAACHGILNTIFIAPATKPDWFDDLNQKLDAAKVLATQWIDDLAPSMTAEIPSQIINYNATYQAVTSMIVKVLEEDPLAQGKDNPTITKALHLAQALENELGKIIQKVEQVEDQLKTWGDAMQKAHDDLYTGAVNIQNMQTDLKADIDKMNDAIAGLHTMIDAQRQIISDMGIVVGVGVFAIVAGVALTIVTLGAGAVVAGLGVAAVVGGGITWGIMQNRVNSELADIAKDQQHLDDDKRQLVALGGLSMASQTAISSTAAATLALSDVKTMWKSLQKAVQETIDKLKETDVTLDAIDNDIKMQTAQHLWDDVTSFAKQLIGMSVPVETKTLPMSAAAAA